MLFISAEKSKQEETDEFFKKLWDGSPKEYPNGSMMIFIPLNSGANVSTDYRAKILFNHDKFNREEDAACKGGLQDLNQKK